MNYFEDLLRFHKFFFFKCFTNHVLHFDNTTTFKNENDAKLKREFELFTNKAIFLCYFLQFVI